MHEYNDRSYPGDARFLGYPTLLPCMVRTLAKIPLVSAGVTVQFNPNVAIFGHYDGIFGRDNYDNNSVSGGLVLSF